MLARELAERGQFPPVDVLASVSRVMNSVITPEHSELAVRSCELLAAYRGAEDLISIGAYVAGSDPRVDAARAAIEPLRAFLSQGVGERATLATTVESLASALAVAA